MSGDNIMVAIKSRPFIRREQSEKLKSHWNIQEMMIFQIDEDGHRLGEPFSFDHIFDEHRTNKDVYGAVVEPLVKSCLEGFNSTIFAYGQTSSGKTHTMMGGENTPGIIQLAVSDIFEYVNLHKSRRYLISCSYFEIYNEKIYDLLDKNGQDLKIREDFYGNTFVNAKEEVVTLPSQVFELMKIGNKIRKIGCTNMNERSSRSHTIFRFTIESTENNIENGPVQHSQLNLVDLAGSERISHTKAAGERLKEGVNINKSLSVLGNVIRQLSDSEGFINYRDSKLTRLLQHALGGNAKSLIIATITLAAGEETKSTLEFAQRAKVIKNKPKINEILTEQDKVKQYELVTAGYKDRLEKEKQRILEMEREKEEREKEILKLKQQVKLIDMFTKGPEIKKVEKEVPRRHTVGHYGSRIPLPSIPESSVLPPTTRIFGNGLKQPPDDEELFLKAASQESDEDFMKMLIEESLEDVLGSTGPNLDEMSHSQTTTPEPPDTDLTFKPETPSSLLRERLKYLEESYTSLQEFTKLESECKEKDIDLVQQLMKEKDNLLKDLIDLNIIIKEERKKKEQLKVDFEDEITSLKSKLEYQTKKSSEFGFALEQITAEREALKISNEQMSNDNQFLLEQQKLNYENQMEYMAKEIKRLNSLQTEDRHRTELILQETIKSLEEKNQQLHEANELLKSKYEDKIAQYESELNNIDKRKLDWDILSKLYNLQEILLASNIDVQGVSTQTDSRETELEFTNKMEAALKSIAEEKEETQKENERLMKDKKAMTEKLQLFEKLNNALQAERKQFRERETTFKETQKCNKEIEKEFKKIKVEFHALTNKIVSLEKERDTYKGKLANASAELAQQERTLTELIVEKNILSQMGVEDNKQYKTLKDELERTKEVLTKDMQNVELLNFELKQELKETTQELKEKMQNVEMLNSKLQEKEEQLKKETNEKNSILNTLNQKIENLERENKGCKENAEMLNSKLQDKLKKYNKQEEKLKKEIHEKNAMLNTLNEKIGNLERANEKSKKDIVAYQELTELDHTRNMRQKETELEIIELRVEIQNMTKEFEESANNLKVVQELNSALEEELNKYKEKKHPEMKKNNDMLKHKLCEKEAQLSKLQDELEECKKRESNFSEIEEYCETLKQEINDIQALTCKLQDELEEYKKKESNVSEIEVYCGNLKQEINDIQSQNYKLQGELEEYRKKESSFSEMEGYCETLKQEINDIKSLNCKLQNELEEYRKKESNFSEMQGYCDNLKQEINDIQSRNCKLQIEVEECQKKESKFNEIEGYCESLKQEISDIKSVNGKLQDELEECNKKGSSFGDIDGYCEPLKQEISDIKALNCKLQVELEEYRKKESKFSEIEGYCETLKQEISDIKSLNGKLQDDLEAYKKKESNFIEMERYCEILKQEINENKDSVNILHANIETLESEKEECNKHIALYEEKLEAKDIKLKELVEVNNKNNKLTLDIQKIYVQLTDSTQELENSKLINAELQEELNLLRKKEMEIEEKYESLKKEVVRKEEQIIEMNDKIAHLIAEKECYKNEINECNMNIDKITEELLHEGEEITKLQKKLDKSSEIIPELNKNLTVLEQQNKTLSKEIDTLNELLYLTDEETITKKIWEHTKLLETYETQLQLDTCRPESSPHLEIDEILSYLFQLRDIIKEINLQDEIDSLVLNIQRDPKNSLSLLDAFCKNVRDINNPDYISILDNLHTIRQNNGDKTKAKLNSGAAKEKKYLLYLNDVLQRITSEKNKKDMIKHLQSKISELAIKNSQELDTHKKRIKDLEARILQLQNEIYTMKCYLDDKTSECSYKDEKIQRLEKNISSLREELNTSFKNFAREIETEKTRYTQLEQSIQNSHLENLSLADRIKELENYIGDLKSSIPSAASEKGPSPATSTESMKEMRRRKRQSIHDQRRGLDTSDTSSFGDTSEESSVMEKDLKAKIEKLTAKVEELTNENNSLEFEVQGFIRELDDYKQYNRDHEIEIESLKEQLKIGKGGVGVPQQVECQYCKSMKKHINQLEGLQKENKFKIVDLQTKIYDLKSTYKVEKNNQEEEKQLMKYKISELKRKLGEYPQPELKNIDIQCDILNYQELLEKYNNIKRVARWRREEGNILRARLGLAPDSAVT